MAHIDGLTLKQIEQITTDLIEGGAELISSKTRLLHLIAWEYTEDDGSTEAVMFAVEADKELDDEGNVHINYNFDPYIKGIEGVAPAVELESMNAIVNAGNDRVVLVEVRVKSDSGSNSSTLVLPKNFQTDIRNEPDGREINTPEINKLQSMVASASNISKDLQSDGEGPNSHGYGLNYFDNDSEIGRRLLQNPIEAWNQNYDSYQREQQDPRTRPFHEVDNFNYSEEEAQSDLEGGDDIFDDGNEDGGL